MGKAKIFPTCRICEKLNTEMTHCAIYGALVPGQADNTAIANACSKSGQYIRMLRAVPNEYNYGKKPDGTLVDEQADAELLVFDVNEETTGFQERHGMTLEEWARVTFTKNPQ